MRGTSIRTCMLVSFVAHLLIISCRTVRIVVFRIYLLFSNKSIFNFVIQVFVSFDAQGH